MLLKKKGFPEKDEIVLCTVTSVYPHSVFVTLDEYDHRSGIIHISEISPGRIRNIRDYVVEGKKIICKILRVDKEKGHLDLSLRRVNDSQKRLKSEELKQEQKAEKIVEFVARKFKLDFKKLYIEILAKVEKDYGALHPFFEDIVLGDGDLKLLGLKDDVTKEFDEVIRQRIKPPEVLVKGELKLVSYDTDGVEIVKNALLKAEKVDEAVNISYKGAGAFNIEVKAEEYKEADKKMFKAAETAIKSIEKKGGEGSFEKIETK